MILVLCVVLGPFAFGHLQDAASRKTEARKAEAAPRKRLRRLQVPVSLHADASGYFQTDAILDGWLLRMVVDTGATLCLLSQEDAERIGVRVSPGNSHARS